MSDAKRMWRGLLVAPALACMVMVGCGDDDGDDDPEGDGAVALPDAGDAGIRSDGSTPTMDGSTPNIDAGQDSGQQPQLDGGYRSGKTVTDQQIVVKLSETGHDRFLGVAYDAEGNIYAAGYRSDGTQASADTAFVLAKFLPNGSPDNTFGSGGVASVNVAVGGQNIEQARGVVVLQSKQIVIAGNVDHQVLGLDAGVLARDTDIALARFQPDGGLDTTFGNGGVVRQNPGDGFESTLPDGGISLAAADSFWSLALSGDKYVLHVASRADGPAADGGLRTDTDFALLRLNADGTPDTTFNGTGVRKTDVAQVNASARTATVLSDGKIVGSGYATSTILTNSTTTAQQPVLYKVNADGTPDTSFATTDRVALPGVWHDYARPDMKNGEAYTAALQGTKLVTIGYGPTPGTGTGTDVLLFRFNADGTQDKSFGVGGAAFLDAQGQGDNGRGLAVLSDNRIIGVGIGRPTPAVAPTMGNPPGDALVGILGPDGQPDQSFAPNGVKLYNVGGPSDELHNIAVSPNGKQAVAVGVKSATTDTGSNDDGLLILLNTGL